MYHVSGKMCTSRIYHKRQQQSTSANANKRGLVAMMCKVRQPQLQFKVNVIDLRPPNESFMMALRR